MYGGIRDVMQEEDDEGIWMDNLENEEVLRLANETRGI